MAQPDPKIIEDEEEFLDDVAAFHRVRGTNFDREGKLSGRPMSLHKLYKMVMERGGYDALSKERMAWRSLVRPFGFSSQHEGAMTFQIKSLYYKNLAAYEIAKYWGETPPPREILEDLTAKGGDLRSRTLENYPIPGHRESMALVDVHESEDDPSTPRKFPGDGEEPNSASRYPTRMLRQDPKRTQLFQPDTNPARGRIMRSTASPQPQSYPSQPTYSNASSDPRHPSFNIQNYEPRPPMALTLRPVITPGSNPDVFFQRKAMALAQKLPRVQPEPQQFLKGHILSMGGPNIYLRCLYGLRSGIPEEQSFALHHLVKVSFERGDKYKFEGFPFLAESLLEKALEIIPLVYGTKWKVSYSEKQGMAPENVINAAFGIPDILTRIEQLKATAELPDDVTTDEDATKLDKLCEAALVILNMVTLEENAKFISNFALFRDFLTIAITLPPQPRLAEFKHYALEMAEQVTRYYLMLPQDPLYLSMLPYLQSPDRSMTLSALRAINRIGIELDPVFQITGVPLSTIERLISLTLLECDDELVEACLDFLYEYTATYENNIAALSESPELYSKLMPRLVTLMNHSPSTHEEVILNKPKPQRPVMTPTIPQIPSDLHEQLLQYPEPTRSSRWLKCCFEEYRDDDITQIAIWQAYQSRFQHNQPVPAAEFIKNVSSTFSTAQAQVINGVQPRFIIKGIRPRRVLVDTSGQPYFKCFWEIAKPDPYDPVARSTQRHLCQSWKSTRRSLWNHIVQDHLNVARDSQGRFANPTGEYSCRWTGCMRSAPFSNANDAAAHVRSHIPETGEEMAKLILELTGAGPEKEAEVTKHTSYYTAIDEAGNPVGISFMSVMIMRNLARFANKHGSEFEKSGIKLMSRLFGHVMRDIWHVFSLNRTLRHYLGQLIDMIEKGEREEKKGVKRELEDDTDSITG
ncbi:hypothetical protein DV737_g1175, partial [Chaetothyriales sp. CBS 132003]